MTSHNGLDDWQVAHNAAQSYPSLFSIVAAAGKYFAVGNQGAIISSSDGINYQAVTFPNNDHNIAYYSIAYNGQNQLVALGDDQNSLQLYAAVSNDNGVTWQLNPVTVTNNNNTIISVVNTLWDDQLQQYIAIGNALNKTDLSNPGQQIALISKDGIKWHGNLMDSQLKGFFEGNTLTKFHNMYLAGGISMDTSGKVFANLMWSNDGIKWTSTTDSAITQYNGIIGGLGSDGNNVILLIKKYGTDQANSKVTILKSSNGQNNFQIVSDNQFYESTMICGYSILWANNSFLISGMLDSSDMYTVKEQILRSDQNGENWYSPLTQNRP